ncbi:hypothetical protein [Nocardia carnea]|uniref:hypothetical protein n=1 Tax=Nocardia carnea TaxID=37328 RepID=UPI002454BEDA|nr:hypothetical protein [Nocardia carnea]
MRISRNFDNDDDREPDPENGGDMDRLMDILSDELDEYLAAWAAAGETTSDADADQRPPTPVKPLLRLVKTTKPEPAAPVEDDNLAPIHRPAPEIAAQPDGRVPRWVRVTLPGSAVVVTLTATIAAGQPAVVAVPVAAYGAGWTAYLWWNAAYRPPLREVAAAIASALGRTAGATANGARSVVGRAESARTRHEKTRTNPA